MTHAWADGRDGARKTRVHRGRAQPAHETWRASGAAHGQENAVPLRDRDFLDHALERAGLDRDDDEVRALQRVVETFNRGVVPGGHAAGLRLEPGAKHRVQLGRSQANVIQRYFARQVGAEGQVEHELAHPLAAAADVGDLERDRLRGVGLGHG